MDSTIHSLWGGAFQVALPLNFSNVSDSHPIPDNQEVFTDFESDSAFIGEVLEPCHEEPLESIKMIFNDLAEQQKALNPHIESYKVLEPSVLTQITIPNVELAILRGT